MYLRARYYDPSIGRFLSRDPVPYLQPYGYANNNPIRFGDATGLSGAEHFVADMLGFLPGVGTFVDLGHGAYYLSQGEWKNALWYAGAAVPLIGDLGVGARFAVKYGDDVYAAARYADEAQLLLKAGPPNLPQSRLEHIVSRHWHSSGTAGTGKFERAVGLKELRSMIRHGVQSGSSRPNTYGRPGTIFEHDFGYPIGTDRKGGSTSRLRIVVDEYNDVVTAFPY